MQYHLFFRMKINPFALPRKAEKFTAPWRNISRNILEITPHGMGDATCITVDASDGLFVTEDFVVTHNSPLDIYGQYRFLDPGIFGTSFTKFRGEYAVMGGFQGHQILNYRNPEMLHDKMFLIAHRVMSKDVFDLPKFQSEIRTCELSGTERRVYQEMDINFCAQVASGEVTAANALVKLLRLQEITSGYLDAQPVGDSKKKLLADVLEDFSLKEPIVIFARFTNDLRAIKEVVESQGRTYGELSGHANELSQWQIGNKDVLGVQIKSGREGVDFTRARYSIYYSLGFSLGDYEQSIKRLDRPGQLREGMYIHLLAKDTVDFKVMEALEKRQEVISSVLNQYKGSDDFDDVPEIDDASGLHAPATL
jgi:SNF2 family DNA or RNA helicase